MAKWVKDGPSSYVSEDGRYAITHDQVPLSCAGPHPVRDGGHCPGDETHYPWRWILSDEKTDDTEICKTLTAAKGRVEHGEV
jgi:hypothetical protein